VDFLPWRRKDKVLDIFRIVKLVNLEFNFKKKQPVLQKAERAEYLG
jgi:hypothetical protein